MIAYVVSSDKKIEPFGDYPLDCLIANEALCEHQRKTLASLGIHPCTIVETVQEINDDNEHLVFGENLYFTPEFIAQFVNEARTFGTICICCMAKDVTARRTAPKLQGVKDKPFHYELNLRYYPPVGQREVEESIVPIGCDQLECRVPIPEHMCGERRGYAVPMTDTFAIQINHWVNLWAANVLTALANVARIKKASYFKTVPWKIFRNLNTIGEGCRIHKKAYVGASVIGNNVMIEPGAIVRASIIGNNVHIGNGVVVEESVLGDGCKILHGHIMFSCLGPGAFSVSDFVSASLVGKNAFIGANATLTDFRFDGKNVLAIQDGVSVDTGNRFLGVCLGNETYIGAGCTIAPGRIVPSGCKLRQASSRVYSNSQRDWQGFSVK
jgi:acetyltransferase-like isoleucine patch superfamily enzyme